MNIILLSCALASAIYLAVGRLAFNAATVAAAVLFVELAFRLGWFHFSLGGLPLSTIFAIAVAVCGFLAFQAEGQKLRVAAATVVLIAGGLQTLAAFGIGG